MHFFNHNLCMPYTILIIIEHESQVFNFSCAQFSRAQLVCDQMFHAPFHVLNMIVDSFLKYFILYTHRLPKTINIIPYCKICVLC